MENGLSDAIKMLDKTLDKVDLKTQTQEMMIKIGSKINEIVDTIEKYKIDTLKSQALALKEKFEEIAPKIVYENPSGGRRKTRRFKKTRLMSKAYCKKTPCKKMGFTQKASCRPWKNCYRKSKK